MEIELFLLLVLIGAGTGSVSAIIRVAPAFIAIPVLYFFLPDIDGAFDHLMLPIVATCLIAFIPVHLYAWIKYMQKGAVDFQRLVDFTPGIVMGAVIGAQLLSLIDPFVFKIAFSIVSFLTILNTVFASTLESINGVNIRKLWQLPIGLLLGVMSLMSGNSGRVLAEYLYAMNKVHLTKRQGTIEGVAVFASIAAFVGFIYPAQAVSNTIFDGFVGAIHISSLLILSVSHFFFYWFCQNKGNELDKKVLTVSFVIFLICSLIRLWI